MLALPEPPTLQKPPAASGGGVSSGVDCRMVRMASGRPPRHPLALRRYRPEQRAGRTRPVTTVLMRGASAAAFSKPAKRGLFEPAVFQQKRYLCHAPKGAAARCCSIEPLAGPAGAALGRRSAFSANPNMDSQTLGSVASSSKLARIKEIGFVPAGCWRLEAGDLSFKLDPPLAGKRNVLYAFVVDGDVKYIGKTVVTLKQRVTGYKNPASSQTTNVRNNEQLRNAFLTHVTQVEIFALPDNGLLHYGRFPRQPGSRPGRQLDPRPATALERGKEGDRRGKAGAARDSVSLLRQSPKAEDALMLSSHARRTRQ